MSIILEILKKTYFILKLKMPPGGGLNRDSPTRGLKPPEVV